jgi:nucleotide-binding universal stress UspA family protein
MPRLFQSIFHPTSFSGATDAFAHALRIAVAARGELQLLHVNAPNEAPDFSPFPAIRQTLASWGMLDADAPSDAITQKLGVRVKKELAWDSNPVVAISNALASVTPDLLVLSIADRSGLPDIFQDSTAEAITRAARTVSLCVRRGGGGFVSEQTGEVALKSILAPVVENVRNASAIDAVLSLGELLEVRDLVIHVVHVGGETPEIPDLPAAGARFRLHAAHGPVVDTILDMQRRADADLICLPVARHHGLIASVVGSTTERVMRRAECPVLLAPAG